MSQKEQTTKVKQRKVTLSDIAESLGVSKGTVSMAINGNSVVAAATREKVLLKIDELGYVYNRAAAGLTTGVSRTVGLAVHNIANPYFSEVCASVESTLSLSDRTAFLCNTNESLDKQSRFIKTIGEQNADGLILCPAVNTTAAHLQPLIDQLKPIVLIARNIEGAQLDFVGNDDSKAMQLATEHLIKLGHTRIAMIGSGDASSVSKDRRDGYFAAMHAANIDVEADMVVDSSIYFEGGLDAARSLLTRPLPPTAIACFTDIVALGAISALCELGMQPGKDVAVIGCDGIAEGARAYVNLSTVNVQKADIGKSAAELLTNRIHIQGSKAEKIIKEPQLVIRGSCGGKIQ